MPDLCFKKKGQEVYSCNQLCLYSVVFSVGRDQCELRILIPCFEQPIGIVVFCGLFAWYQYYLIYLQLLGTVDMQYFLQIVGHIFSMYCT
jgi:hypothetical protein